MSKKHVPEEAKKTVPSREEQLAWLRKKVLGNEAFSRLRGKVKVLTSADISQPFSLTIFCDKWSLKVWDLFASDVRAMGRLLTQFDRDGWSYAFEDLAGALANSGHLLPGEIVPIERTYPVTLVMFEPEKTFVLEEWLRTGGCDYDVYLANYLGFPEALCQAPLSRQVGWLPPSETLTVRLFQVFPSLEGFAQEMFAHREQSGRATGGDIMDVFRRTYDADVLAKFGVIEKVIEEKETFTDYRVSGISVRPLGPPPFDAFLVEANQTTALSGFSREQKERIATWRFNWPDNVHLSHKIGFHPESEHESWKKEYPALVSRGCSQGFGAIILESVEGYGFQSERGKQFPFRFVVGY